MQNYETNPFLRDKDKCLAIMPIFHGFGLSVCIHCIQYFGGESILLPQFDARSFDKIMKSLWNLGGDSHCLIVDLIKFYGECYICGYV